MNFKISRFKTLQDSRGKLIVFLRAKELKNAKRKFGQIYFVTFAKKGAVRGNHYHKRWYEWFGIVEGRVKVVVEDIRTKKRESVILDAKKDKYVRLSTGPYVAHAIQSLTNYASLVSYADAEWSQNDTYDYKLV